MDWSNETYVRLYTRDSTNWKRLGWDGQCVLMQMLRKLDRAGTMELAGLEPWEAVMLHTGAPEDACRRGIDAILRVGTAEVRGDRLVLPSFIEAQECSKSDKQRAKESRERQARGESRTVTAPSQNVTRGSQNVTHPSQVVTAGHEPSQPVTTRHSLLCYALPSIALPTSAVQASDARARPEPVDRLPEPETGFTDRRMRSLFTAEFEAVQKTTPSLAGKSVGELHAQVMRTASLQGVSPETLFVDSVRAWLSNPLESREQQFPLACFQARWGSLTARGAPVAAAVAVETVESLGEAAKAALLRGDHAEANRLAKRRDKLRDDADRRNRGK